MSTILIAGAYAILATVLVAGAGRDLGQAVADYAPQVSWLTPDTTTARLAALKAAGRPETAALYALVASLSWGLIGAMFAGGFALGVLNKGATVLGVDKAVNYMIALTCLYAVATVTEVALHASGLSAPQGGLHAIPAFWFFGMIPSAAILARVGALIAHDFGSLAAIAIAPEPLRLQALVAAAEEKRGVASLEAKLARLIARARG